MEKHERIHKLLLEGCKNHEDLEWPWLGDNTGRVDKRDANKFLLGARIDYHTSQLGMGERGSACRYRI